MHSDKTNLIIGGYLLCLLFFLRLLDLYGDNFVAMKCLILNELASGIHQNNESPQNLSPYKSFKLFFFCNN